MSLWSRLYHRLFPLQIAKRIYMGFTLLVGLSSIALAFEMVFFAKRTMYGAVLITAILIVLMWLLLFTLTKDLRNLAHVDVNDGKKEFFATIFNASPDMVSVRRLKDGRYVDVNPSWLQHTGYTREEVIGKKATDLNLATNDEIRKIEQEMIEGRSFQKRITYRAKSGEIRKGIISTETFEMDGEKYLLVVLTDTTKFDLMESEMLRYERLNVIGQMAASISHEVRNPMTTIRGFLQLHKERPQHLSHGGMFDLMIDELDRASSIITEFLTLGRTREIDPKTSNVNDTINSLLPLLKADALENGKQIKVNLNKTDDFEFDDKQIRQLILNLTRNGLEAMDAGGKLSITTYQVSEGAVVLTVKDQGGGIDPEILDKLGTPFLTTKEKGTGLGLASCFNIAKAHNAKIDVKTDANGTQFAILFPIRNP